MVNLTNQHCSHVTASTPHLSAVETEQNLAKLHGWSIYEKDGEPRLERFFV